jgi:hypothetical protein
MTQGVESRYQMTESEYWNQLQLFAIEVDNVNVIYQTYEEINCISLTDQDVRSALNRHALFWNVQVYSLQTSLMMVLGRIFDTDGDVHSVHKVISATLSNVKIFSKDSLEKRKITHGVTGKDLEHFMIDTWSPTSASDLRYLKKAVATHATHYRNVYGPIRDKFIAHRVINDPNDVWNLFAATNRTEIGETIAFLGDLVEALQDLYQNGREPVLGSQRSVAFNRKIRDGVKEVLGIAASMRARTVRDGSGHRSGGATMEGTVECTE